MPLSIKRILQLYLAVAIAAGFCFAASQSQLAQSEQTTNALSQLLYGTWYTYPPGNPDTDAIRHEFRHNPSDHKDELIVTHMCPGDYRGVIARVVSPVEISPSTIRVLKSSSDVEHGELNSECRVNIESGLWSYVLSEDNSRLTITNPGGSPDIMELARQDANVTTALPSNVYGTWLLPPQDDGNTKVQIKLVFYGSADPTKGKVRQIATCIKGNDTLVSQADSDIRVSPDHIKILGAASHVQRDGPFTCKVTITPGDLRYVISPTGTTMKLSGAAGPSLTLTRESQVGLN